MALRRRPELRSGQRARRQHVPSRCVTNGCPSAHPAAVEASFPACGSRELGPPVVSHDPRHDRLRLDAFCNDRRPLDHGAPAFVSTREARDHIADRLVVDCHLTSNRRGSHAPTVGQDRLAPGSGTGMETAMASGSALGASPGMNSLKPTTCSAAPINCGGRPHSGQATRSAAVAEVNRN